MKTLSALAAGAALLCFSAFGAHADPSKKTWVSSTGTDTGNCPLTAPCASFAYAVTQTIAGGELDVKDSGAYGSFTITQSISVIAADGVLATVGMAAGTNGITINAGANDAITIQGLTIDGHTTGEDGIQVISAKTVYIRNTSIRNVMTGIYFEGGTNFVIGTTITGTTKAILNQSYNSSIIYLGGDTLIANVVATYGNMNSYGDNYINGNSTSDTQESVVKSIPRS